MATGYEKSAFESVVGTEVNTPTLSTKILYTPLIGFELDTGVNPLERDDELRGEDQPLQILSDTFAGQWTKETRAYPDTVGFEAKGILGAPTTTAGNGVITDPDGTTIPTGAHRHVYTAPFGPSGDAPLTTERVLAYKDQSVFVKCKGCATQELSLENPETGGVMLRANGPVTYYTRIADPSLTPSYESLATRPFFQRDLVVVTWLANSAASTGFDVSIANDIVDMDDLSVGPTQHRRGLAKGDAPIIFTGNIQKRLIDADDWDALINATGFAAKMRWKSRSIIASSYPYQLWIEFDNCQYNGGGPEGLANRRRIGASFPFKATYDGAGASVTVTLVNNVSSYV